ncbi:MAG: hypothetical protein JNL95_14700 [Chitinophagales bacterium]|nr:hypothetical protein [Chitinophagales bacterium]
MNKLLFCFSVVALVAVSSCKKVCVQCAAYDKKSSIQVYKTGEVCGTSFDMKNFKNRFEKNFSEYNTSCNDVN